MSTQADERRLLKETLPAVAEVDKPLFGVALAGEPFYLDVNLPPGAIAPMLVPDRQPLWPDPPPLLDTVSGRFFDG